VLPIFVVLDRMRARIRLRYFCALLLRFAFAKAKHYMVLGYFGQMIEFLYGKVLDKLYRKNYTCNYYKWPID